MEIEFGTRRARTRARDWTRGLTRVVITLSLFGAIAFTGAQVGATAPLIIPIQGQVLRVCDCNSPDDRAIAADASIDTAAADVTVDNSADGIGTIATASDMTDETAVDVTPADMTVDDTPDTAVDVTADDPSGTMPGAVDEPSDATTDDTLIAPDTSYDGI